MPRILEGHLAASGMRFAIVVSRFNSFITDRLLAGAMDALTRSGADTETFTRRLDEWPVDVIGANCSVGPKVMLETIEKKAWGSRFYTLTGDTRVSATAGGPPIE